MKKKKLIVNHTAWATALSSLDRGELRRLCDEFGLDRKGLNRDRMASMLAKKIDVCAKERMVLICDFEND